ncbi:gluconokinase [Vibrio hippocampi]|uniref:Gluconokinase n=1 Tax=Vibrio hippocampi TaxID=654686 RepID=A0ABM8ZH97_9VIBR|nr:gluconokinase [Vibrio hippocampi]CAH0525069.1 Thermoresistant gluconokinase [Vibrio hippocampi]
MAGFSIVVMGVCSSGKSTIGELLAKRLNTKFIDGDDLHPKENVQKMSAGIPLTDEDRTPWLNRVNDAIYSVESKGESMVLVCSALKKQYRDLIRQGNQSVMFVFLDGSIELVKERISQRNGHYMKPEMVDSQFAALEKPYDECDVITVNIDQSVPDLINECLLKLETRGVTCVKQ